MSLVPEGVMQESPFQPETSVSTVDRADSAPRPRLVLITGAGRSGTSTIAGIFSRLGAHIPEPMLAANASNPRGFYESSWPVRFHRRLFKKASIEQTDGRPVAGSSAMAAVDERARTDLRHWLEEQLDGRDLVVVKDPRAAWVSHLWAEAAQESGAELSFVTMIRHPSEVIGSRATYYAANRPAMTPREFAVWNLCGWINQNLTLERQTRHSSRVFLPYTELLADARGSIVGLLSDLRLPADLITAEATAQIDEFVEPRLRRHTVDWGDLALPSTLIDIAEDTWRALSRMADRRHDPLGAHRALDDVGERYATLYADSQAIAHDHASARARDARRRGLREGRRKAEEALTGGAQQGARRLQHLKTLVDRIVRRARGR